jgi:hypothetical protein
MAKCFYPGAVSQELPWDGASLAARHSNTANNALQVFSIVVLGRYLANDRSGFRQPFRWGALI